MTATESPESPSGAPNRALSGCHACPVCTGPGTVAHFAQVDARDYWHCPACDAVFMEPRHRPDAEFERAYYGLHRNDIDDAGYRRYLDRIVTPLLACLPPGQSGLDFGCGPGPALAAMLEAAGHRMALYDPLFHNDPAALDRTYDFVTCTEVAEHFHRPREEFARLGRLVKPGGWLAVMTRFRTPEQPFAGWHYRRDPTHVVFYTAATFGAIATAHGWRCTIPCADVVLLQTAGVAQAGTV